MFLTSFAELAKVFGSPVKAKTVSKKASFLGIESACGRKAAILWACLQDQEATKASGRKGEILHSPDTLAVRTGYTQDEIINSLILLIKAEHARYSPAGYVKAA